jgi:hypothetical protein
LAIRANKRKLCPQLNCGHSFLIHIFAKLAAIQCVESFWLFQQNVYEAMGEVTHQRR